MPEHSELELFRFRRMLDRLASRLGRGTELISIYIPHGKQLSDVMRYLREEYGTASNIKSKTTRKNVQDALTRAMQRLKLFRSVPENGLCIFCGMIPQGPPGSERMETYVITPIKPITSFIYRCDARFLLDPLLEMVKERDVNYGIVTLDTQRATFAILSGRRLQIVKTITSGIAGKHRAGGQSARRFERLRKMEITAFFRRISRHIDKIYLQVPNLEGIIIGGPGPTKDDFVKKATYHYTLKEKTLAVVNTGYADEEGVKEAIEEGRAILEGLRYTQERRIVQEFLHEIGRDTGLGVYGEDEIRKGLSQGRVRTLLVSEDLSILRLSISCLNCGYSETRMVRGEDAAGFRQSLSSRECPRCSSPSLTIEDERELVEELIRLGEGSGADVRIISTQTEEGVMLKRSFSGIAAILKKFD